MASSATTISLQSLAQHIPGTVNFSTQEIVVGNVPADAIEHEPWMDDLAKSYDAHWLPQELDFEAEVDTLCLPQRQYSDGDIQQEDMGAYQHSKMRKTDQSYRRSCLEYDHYDVVTTAGNNRVKQIAERDDLGSVIPEDTHKGKKTTVIFPRRGSIFDLHDEDVAMTDPALAHKPLFLQSRERFICDAISPVYLKPQDEPVQRRLKKKICEWEDAEEYLDEMREKILAYVAAHPRKRY